MLVLLVCFGSSYSRADEANIVTSNVNEYGWDCDANPFVSSCGWNPPDSVEEKNISDDGYVSVPLDFAFPFGSQVFTHSWMHSNGVISFLGINRPDMGHLCCNGVNMENYTGSTYQYMIAPLWTDIINIPKDLDGDGINDTGFYVEGDDDSQKYFWRNISEFYNAQTNNTFGVEIKNDGQIDIYQYEVDIRNHNVFTGIIGGEGEVIQEYYGRGQSINNYNNLTSDNYNNYSFEGPTYSNIPNFTDPNFFANCSANPLYNANCPGYAEAYAAILFAENCAADPLYDNACAGYETAYYNQQCSIDPLYDTGCTGYADAYYTQQCTLDPLYDTGCDGYTVAYTAQQCGLDPLYDASCEGYEEAYYNTYIRPTLEQQAEDASGVDTDGVENTTTVDVVTTEDFSEPQILDDPVIDNIVFDEPEVITYEIETIEQQDFGNEQNNVVEVLPTQVEESRETETEVDIVVSEIEEEERQEELIEVASNEERENEETDREDESNSDVDESVDTSGDDESSDAGQEGDRETEDGGEGGSEPTESSRDDDGKDEKKESRKEKVKKAVKKRAAQLADTMGTAASIEQQQAIQEQVLALIGFNPDFGAYSGYTVPQTQFYQDEGMQDGFIPNSRRGLRNGLAQQILHEKMVDMQYD